METLAQKLERADRLQAITQRVGFALWQIQELEGCAAQVFVLLAQAKKGMGIAAGQELVEKAQGKTFGATVRQLIQADLLSPRLEPRFASLLNERNWLVHKSRASSRDAVHSDQATENLMKRLGVIAEESMCLLRELSALAEDHVKKYGVTEQQIEAMTEALLEQWHGTDAI